MTSSKTWSKLRKTINTSKSPIQRSLVRKKLHKKKAAKKSTKFQFMNIAKPKGIPVIRGPNTVKKSSGFKGTINKIKTDANLQLAILGGISVILVILLVVSILFKSAPDVKFYDLTDDMLLDGSVYFDGEYLGTTTKGVFSDFPRSFCKGSHKVSIEVNGEDTGSTWDVNPDDCAKKRLTLNRKVKYKQEKIEETVFLFHDTEGKPLGGILSVDDKDLGTVEAKYELSAADCNKMKKVKLSDVKFFDGADYAREYVSWDIKQGWCETGEIKFSVQREVAESAEEGPPDAIIDETDEPEVEETTVDEDVNSSDAVYVELVFQDDYGDPLSGRLELVGVGNQADTDTEQIEGTYTMSVEDCNNLIFIQLYDIVFSDGTKEEREYVLWDIMEGQCGGGNITFTVRNPVLDMSSISYDVESFKSKAIERLEKLRNRPEIPEPETEASYFEQIVLPSSIIKVQSEDHYSFKVGFFNNCDQEITITPKVKCTNPGFVMHGDEQTVAAESGMFEGEMFTISSTNESPPARETALCVINFDNVECGADKEFELRSWDFDKEIEFYEKVQNIEELDAEELKTMEEFSREGFKAAGDFLSVPEPEGFADVVVPIAIPFSPIEVVPGEHYKFRIVFYSQCERLKITPTLECDNEKFEAETMEGTIPRYNTRRFTFVSKKPAPEKGEKASCKIKFDNSVCYEETEISFEAT